MSVTEYGPARSLMAARVLTVSGSTIVKTELFYPREITINPQVNSLDFEGNDTSQRIDQIPRIEAQVTCDKLNLTQEATLFGKTPVAAGAGLESDDAWGVWWGDPAEIGGTAAGLEYEVAFKDESVTPNVTTKVRYQFPRGVLLAKRLQTAVYQGKHVDVLNFVFYRTAVDLLGATLSGVPSGGAYFRQSKTTS